MKFKRFLQLISIVLILCLSSSTALAYGIGEEQVVAYEKNTFVVSPQIAKKDIEEIKQYFIQKGYEKETIGYGFRSYNLDYMEWYDSALFFIWAEGEIIGSYGVDKDEEGDLSCYGGLAPFFWGTMNRARIQANENETMVLFSSESGPGVYFMDSGKVLMAAENESHLEGGIKVPEKSKLELMRADINWQLEKGELVKVPVNKNAVYKVEAKNVPYGVLDKKLNNELIALFQSKGYKIANDQYFTMNFYEMDGEDAFSDFGADKLTLDEINKMIMGSGFKALKDISSHYIVECRTLQYLDEYKDPYLLIYRAVMDDQKIAGAWVEVGLYSVYQGDESSTFHYVLSFPPAIDVIYESDEYPHRNPLILGTSQEKIKQLAEEVMKKNGYVKKNDIPNSANNTIGGATIDPWGDQQLKTFFEDFGWKFSDRRFRAVLGSDMSDLETKAAALASSKIGLGKHPLRGDYLGSVYIPPKESIYNSFDSAAMFYYEKEYKLPENPSGFWIDFCYSAEANYDGAFTHAANAWLMVRPQKPNKNGKYERFIYPVNTKLSKIKADITDYYKKLV